MRTKQVEHAEVYESYGSFNVTDKKGREVGYMVTVVRRTFIQAPPDAGSWWSVPAGTWYFLQVQPCRDGAGSGAQVPMTRHASLHDALEYAPQKVTAMLRRYQRKHLAGSL
jgi:hypothetical protein